MRGYPMLPVRLGTPSLIASEDRPLEIAMAIAEVINRNFTGFRVCKLAKVYKGALLQQILFPPAQRNKIVSIRKFDYIIHLNQTSFKGKMLTVLELGVPSFPPPDI